MTLVPDRKDGKIYSPIRKKWLIETPEEIVRQDYVCHLVNDYGYELEQMDEEMALFEGLRGSAQARADLVIYKDNEDKINNRNPVIVIECKAENIKIRSADYFQGQTYAFICHAKFFVTTNLKETKYFKVNPDETPKKLGDEILNIPKADEINDEKKINKLLTETKAFTRKEFTDLLTSCHNIIRNNDKLSPEAAFDEISKILFIKINYERLEKGREVFTLKKYKENKKLTEQYHKIHNIRDYPPYMQTLFTETKQAYREDKLFEENEIIKIRENSFESILSKLEKYNLSDTSDDVKGIAFEEFLGKTFRGELGQFFTPRTIVDFMTHVLDPQENETICDPCCGSGGFLIKSFEYIRDKVEEDIHNNKEKLRTEIEGSNFDMLSEEEQILRNEKIDNMLRSLNTELDGSIIASRIFNLSHNCIFGTDANPRMARVSKMNMIMHGDGHGGVHHHDGLLNVNGIFEERFDVILTNPPFGSRIDRDLKITEADKFNDHEMIRKYTEKYGNDYIEALKQVNDNIGKSLLELYDLGSVSGLTEVLFMERCLHLLKKGGRMGIVLPEGVLNTANLNKVREYFEGRAKIILICSIPQDVFIAAGATVKPSLVFMKRFTEDEEILYKKVTKKAREEIKVKYNEEIISLKGELKILEENNNDKKRQKEIMKELNQIKDYIAEEAKPLIKQYFDYEIPIAKVDKAGITTTGAVCENELLDVEKEFKDYNNSLKLWHENKIELNYGLKEDGQIVFRIKNGKEQILEWKN